VSKLLANQKNYRYVKGHDLTDKKLSSNQNPCGDLETVADPGTGKTNQEGNFMGGSMEFH